MRKDILIYKVASAQSLATAFSTAATVVQFLDNCSYQINITTADSTGSFTVEASNDYDIQNGNITNAGHWAALSLAGGTPTVAAADDVIMINLNQLPFKAIRLTYTPTIAGTGTCDVYIVDKQIGG